MAADQPPVEELPRPQPGLPRGIEVALAGLGLLVLSPLLLVSALAIIATSPGGALFRQVRVGRDGRLFGLLKLRSMRIDLDGPPLTGRVDTRVTPLGRWLRRAKIDEIPQLWNVVVGDMALVGPRPEVPRYVDLADPRWRRVLEVRPGLTDPMTVKLRNEEALMPGSAEERERFYVETLLPMKVLGNLEYLSRRNAASDVSVLMATLIAIVFPGPPPDREELLRRGRI
ncbi:MAG TPA: sugar transferase [Candidatus Eisenbacteria bacterium]|nr:sugar transferase [Candidatus Eisenbacteria bacterium]